MSVARREANEKTFRPLAQSSAPQWLNWVVRAHWVMALLLYTVVTLAISYPLVWHLNDSIIGPGGGDNFWSTWFLWHFRQAVDSGQDPTHTHLLFALLPSAEVFIETFFSGAAGWFLQWIMSPLAAYNVLVLISFPLAGLTMYLLTGEFVDDRVARFVAGFLYSFSTYHFARAQGHIGLVAIEWLPFFAWATIVFYRRPTWTHAALAGLGLALVPLSDIYYVPYCAVPFLLISLLVVVATDRAWLMSIRNLGLSLFALLIGLAMAVPPLGGYLRVDPDVQATLQQYAQSGIEQLSADLAAFFLPDSSNPLWEHVTSSVYASMASPFHIEESLFLGYPLIFLAMLGFVFRRNRSRITLFWLLMSAAAVILALGPTVHVAGHAALSLPIYRLILGGPFLSNFRAPDRLVTVVLLSLAVLSAYAVEAIFARWGRQPLARAALIAATAAVLLLSLSESFVGPSPLYTSTVRVPPVYRQIATDRQPGLLLDLPLLQSGYFQFLQTIHHRPLVYGYVSRISARMKDSVQMLPYLNWFDADATSISSPPRVSQGTIYPVPGGLRGVLQQNHIRYVVLHALDPPSFSWMSRYLTAKLGTPFDRDQRLGMYVWRVSPASPTSSGIAHFDLGSGWVPGTGVRNGAVERVVQQDGQVFIQLARPTRGSISFDATPYWKQMTMQVRLNGTLVHVKRFVQPWATQRVALGTVRLHRGKNVLQIHVVQGCSIPSQLIPGNSDTRCFGFGIQSIHLHRYGG